MPSRRSPRSVSNSLEHCIFQRILTRVGGGLFGFDISSMSGVLGTAAYKNYFDNPLDERQGGISAAMPAGSFLGSLMASYIADKYSRKMAIQVGAAIWIVGTLLPFFPSCRI